MGSDESSNPFVAFKRLADQQFSSLLNLAFGSNPFSSSPSAAAQQFKNDYEAWLKESRNSRTPFEREADDAEGLMKLYNEAQKDAEGGTVPPRCEKDEPRCPYQYSAEEKLSDADTENLCSFFDQMASEALRSTHHASQEPLPPAQPNVPLASLLGSQYSPIKLEQQKPFSERGTAWRAAFEDLLEIENGLGLSEDKASRSDSTESPQEWISKMFDMTFGKHERLMQEAHEHYLENLARRYRCPGVERSQDPDGETHSRAMEHNKEETPFNGIAKAAKSLLSRGTFSDARQLAKRVRLTANHDDNDEDWDENEDEEPDDDGDIDEYYCEVDIKDNEDGDNGETELDLYRRLLFLAKHMPGARIAIKPRVLGHLSNESSSNSEPDNSRPSILSTLTTTEKTTLGDGTTHTKVVLKKRFSDGREESTETVHTQNPVPQKMKQLPPEIHKESEASESQNRERKGWFWS